MVVEPIRPIKIFYCYAHEDKPLRDELGRHLGPLRRSGWITAWHDQEIQPGTDWKQEINVHLNTSDIVLLLISADFMDSDYCYGVEMQRALERHRAGEAHVIPIILRPTDWEETPIGELQALPAEGKAIVLWPVRDEAFRDVVRGIREMVRVLLREEEAARKAEAERVRKAQEERAQRAQEKEASRKAEAEPPTVDSPRQSPVWFSSAASPSQSAQSYMPVPLLSTPQPTKRGISRRTVVMGLGLTGLAVAGSGIVWLASHYGQYSSVAPGHTPNPLPLGTLLYIYRGHSSSVLAVAWSPDGKRIASGSGDNTVQVWDATTGANVFTYRGHSFSVLAVAWSPHGNRIASGSLDRTVQVWDATDGGHVLTYHGHSDWIRSVTWSPDGKRIASGSADGTVQVLDAANGGNLYTYRGHSSAVNAVAWSPDGKRIASGSDDKTVRVWGAADGRNVYTYRGHSDRVDTVAWSPNSKRIASGSDDETVQVWDAANGGNVFSYTGPTDWVNAGAWSPDGRRIASGGDTTVQVWVAG